MRRACAASFRSSLAASFSKAFRRAGNDLAPELPVREQQGDVQPSLCSVDSEDAHLTENYDKLNR
ncbi:MAG: hypothetical protein ACTFAK_10020 [Candidatus Electronema sp. VV]